MSERTGTITINVYTTDGQKQVAALNQGVVELKNTAKEAGAVVVNQFGQPLEAAGGDVAGLVKELEALKARLEEMEKQGPRAGRQTAEGFDLLAASSLKTHQGMQQLEAIMSGEMLVSVRQLDTALTVVRRAFDEAVTEEDRRRYAQMTEQLEKMRAEMVNTAGGGESLRRSGSQVNTTLTNLNRTVQDAPFGFIAVQNNVTELVQSFVVLRRETGSSRAATQALVSGLTGVGGLMFALSAVTSLVLVFGDDIAAALSGGTKEVEEMREALSEMIEDAQETIKEVHRLSGAMAAQRLIKFELDITDVKNQLKEVRDEITELEQTSASLSPSPAIWVTPAGVRVQDATQAQVRDEINELRQKETELIKALDEVSQARANTETRVKETISGQITILEHERDTIIDTAGSVQNLTSQQRERLEQIAAELKALEENKEALEEIAGIERRRRKERQDSPAPVSIGEPWGFLEEQERARVLAEESREALEAYLKLLGEMPKQEVPAAEDAFDRLALTFAKTYREVQALQMLADEGIVDPKEANKRQIQLLERALQDLAANGIDPASAEFQVLADLLEKFKDRANDATSEAAEMIQEIADVAQQGLGVLEQLYQNQHQARMNQIERERSAALDSIDRQIEAERKRMEQHDVAVEAEKRSIQERLRFDRLSATERERLQRRQFELERASDERLTKLLADRAAAERRFEEERKEAARRQAKQAKALALLEIAINTAVAVSKVLGQTGIFGLAAWIPVAALGAAQAAAVAAQPIPEFRKGVTGFQGGAFIAGEEGPEMVVTGSRTNVITNENTERLLAALDRPSLPGAAAFDDRRLVSELQALRMDVQDQTERLERVERVIHVRDLDRQWTDFRTNEERAGRVTYGV